VGVTNVFIGALHCWCRDLVNRSAFRLPRPKPMPKFQKGEKQLRLVIDSKLLANVDQDLLFSCVVPNSWILNP